MSLRLEMLQVSRLAPQLLGDSAELVRDFLLSQLDDSGGFLGRGGETDLYYTVFGLDALHALNAEIPKARVASFLATFGDGEGLDLVHLACLARCWAAVGQTSGTLSLNPAIRDGILRRVGQCRAADGSYAGRPAETAEDLGPGNIYGVFMALGAHQDLGAPLPEQDAVAQFVVDHWTSSGKTGHEPTPVAAAMATALRALGRPAPRSAIELLERRIHPQGGFLAVPGAPMPDLLSTATALHALATLEHPLEPLVEPCLDFIDTLWTNRGAFHGNWADDDVDCEYTFYGLLALGHLSVWSR